jgi:crotonobetainyl-CoA:carnitine CoA-transferase CaiB-like acyl-CoA transferase
MPRSSGASARLKIEIFSIVPAGLIVFDDHRFPTSPLRVANRAQMVEALTRVFKTRTTAD